MRIMEIDVDNNSTFHKERSGKGDLAFFSFFYGYPALGRRWFFYTCLGLLAPDKSAGRNSTETGSLAAIHLLIHIRHISPGPRPLQSLLCFLSLGRLVVCWDGTPSLYVQKDREPGRQYLRI